MVNTVEEIKALINPWVNLFLIYNCGNITLTSYIISLQNIAAVDSTVRTFYLFHKTRFGQLRI